MGNSSPFDFEVIINITNVLIVTVIFYKDILIKFRKMVSSERFPIFYLLVDFFLKLGELSLTE